MSADRVVCASCGSVWMSASVAGLLDRSERCLRCGGELHLARGAREPDTSEVAVGSRGPVGREVASRLGGLGVPHRLVEPSEDRSAMSRAFEGARALVLADAPEAPQAIGAAKAAGVERLVYVSALGARPDATYTAARRSFEVEEQARTAGVPSTILRSSYHLDLLPHLCGPDGVLRNAAGEGRVASVSRGDLADVAVATLTREGHVGRTYDVTGPEAQTMSEIARHLAVASGRRVSYVRESVDESRESRIATGAAVWEAEDWSTCFGAIAAGEMDVVSDTVTTITGREPETLSDFLRKHPESLRHLAPA